MSFSIDFVSLQYSTAQGPRIGTLKVLWASQSLRPPLSSLLQNKRSHRQCSHKGGWLCSNKTLLVNADIRNICDVYVSPKNHSSFDFFEPFKNVETVLGRRPYESRLRATWAHLSTPEVFNQFSIHKH